MGFIKTVKNKLGIGGVKVNLDAPQSLSLTDNMVSGHIILTSKSAQEIQNVHFKLEQTTSVGRGDNKSSKEYNIGEIEIPVNKNIAKGEEIKIDFALPFARRKSSNDKMGDYDAKLMKGLGKLGKLASNEKNEFRLIASAYVKGVLLGPNDIQKIVFN